MTEDGDLDPSRQAPRNLDLDVPPPGVGRDEGDEAGDTPSREIIDFTMM
jgi:hypothetical protein